jgi:hypothetical protein
MHALGQVIRSCLDVPVVLVNPEGLELRFLPYDLFGEPDPLRLERSLGTGVVRQHSLLDCPRELVDDGFLVFENLPSRGILPAEVKQERDVDLLVPLPLLAVVLERRAVRVLSATREVADEASKCRRVLRQGVLGAEAEEVDRQVVAESR